MDNEGDASRQGEVVDIERWKASGESKIASIAQGGARVRLVGIDGRTQKQADDQRLDEREEWEKFWESFRDFER